MDRRFTYHQCPDLPGVELLEATALADWRWYLTRAVWIASVSWEGEAECHQHRHRLDPGRVLCAEPEEVCQSVRVGRAGNLSALFIDASHGPLARVSPAVGCERATTGAAQKPSSLLERFAAFSFAMRSGASAAELGVRLSALLETAQTRCPELVQCKRAPRPRAGVAARLRELLDCDTGREQSLSSLAEKLGVTRFRALRAFKQEFGMTPLDYQMCLRIAGARDALRSGATPAEVAADYGFSDQSHFGRHFKRGVGVSPGQYVRAGRPAASSPTSAAQPPTRQPRQRYVRSAATRKRPLAAAADSPAPACL